MAPGVLIGEICLEIMQHRAGAFLKIRVLQARAQFSFGNFTEDGNGVVKQVGPAARESS